MTDAQLTVATQAASGSVNGYLASGDFTTFSGKANASLGNLASVAINTTLLPASNDGAGLGNGTYSFADLFLASGGIINWAMTDSGSKKIRMDDMTLSLSEGRPPVIIDESKPMPDAYCRIKKEPDRTLIRARLESGEELEFAAFGNAKMTLVIRG